MVMGDRGQMHTLEGLSAAIIMITAAFFVAQSVTVTAPQTEGYVDAQLVSLGEDALTLLDQRKSWENQSFLQVHVLEWNGTTESLEPLEDNLDKTIPRSVRYNVDFAYPGNDTTGNLIVRRVIDNGEPLDNAVTVSRLVTVYDSDINETAANNPLRDISPSGNSSIRTVVEVRLTLWYA